MNAASLLCTDSDTPAAHVVPVGDAIDHDTSGSECPCGAETTQITDTDGVTGTFTVHRYVGAAAPLT